MLLIDPDSGLVRGVNVVAMRSMIGPLQTSLQPSTAFLTYTTRHEGNFLLRLCRIVCR